MGGRASSRSIGLASTSHSRAAFVVAFVVAASAWVVVGQTTTGPSYETVRFTNYGLRLEAYLYRPAGVGPFPLVVHRHSGADPATRWGAVIARLLTDAGYAVLLPERRGTGNAEGQRFTESGDDRDRIARLRAAFIAAEAGDVLAAIEQVTRDTASRIHSKRLAMMGYSAGGSVAVLAAARSDRFRAVITQAPSSLSWIVEAPLREAILATARRIRVPTLCMVAENDNTTETLEASVRRSQQAALLLMWSSIHHSHPERRRPIHWSRQGTRCSLATRAFQSGARMSWHSWRSTCRHTHDQHRRSVFSTHGRMDESIAESSRTTSLTNRR